MPDFARAATSRLLEIGTGDISDIRPRRRDSASQAGVFALLVALLTGALVAFGPAAPAAASERDVIHSLVNEARAADGLQPLRRNANLDAVAAAWAQQMAEASELKHNPNVGDQIPDGWVSWGENIAQGHQSGATMQQGWMDSPGHRKNILGDFSDLGVAFLEADGTTWGVQVFATYAGGDQQSPAAPPVAAPAPAPQPTVDAQPDDSPAADDQAAAEQAAADQKAAADKAAADKKVADEKAAAAKKQAEAKQKAAAAKQRAEAERQTEQEAGGVATAGPSPTAAAEPQGQQASVPQSTSATSPLDPVANPAVLIGMGLALLVALVLLSPTLRRMVLPRRRPARHR